MKSVSPPTYCGNCGKSLGLLPCLLYPAAIFSSTIPFNGFWGNLTVIWSRHTLLNVASEPLSNGSFIWKIPWLDLTSVFPTPPVDIGIDDSCFALDPIDFIAAYLGHHITATSIIEQRVILHIYFDGLENVDCWFLVWLWMLIIAWLLKLLLI